MERKYKKYLVIVGLLIVLGAITGVSYSWWTSTAEQSGINQIQSDCLKISYTDENPIKLDTTYPLTDKEGEALTPYTFTIQNTCSNAIDYTINLGISDTNTLNDEYVAVKLNDNTKRILNSLEKANIKNYTKSYELAKGILNGQESKKYSLRLWMDEHVTVSDDTTNKTFSSKVVVEATLNTLAKVYTDDTLNGADPVLKDNLIPVKINEDDGTVKKANIEEEWYDYSNREWANAVILKDNGTIEEDGTIKEENIESYFVWIPKYKYKIFNMGDYNSVQEGVTQYQEKSQEIEIEFGIYDTVNNTIECTTPASGENGECAVDKWMTPSAFTSFNTNGFWVGKFETGYDEANSTTEAQSDTNAPEKVIIKPNVYSWRSITLGNAYHTSFDYERKLDSHLIKNTEWGAVAYLSHSKYGTCDGDKCTEIMINNSLNKVTGVSAVEAPQIGYNAYQDSIDTTPGQDNNKSKVYPKSNVASTTLNNTGVYDMNGSLYEYVMGYVEGQVGTSGLTIENDLTDKNSKYYDVYDYDTSNATYQRRILGDAIGEMGPFFRTSYSTSAVVINSWYKDYGYINNNQNPFFTRGSGNAAGTTAGIFASEPRAGQAESYIGFRIVLSPQN